MDQFALLDALPILWQVVSASTGFHHNVLLCPAHKTFHKSSRFTYYLHMLLFCHVFYLNPLWGLSHGMEYWGVFNNTLINYRYAKFYKIFTVCL